MNTKSERIAAGIVLLVLIMALMNKWIVKLELFGIDPGSLTFATFAIGGLVCFWLLRQRFVRSQGTRDDFWNP